MRKPHRNVIVDACFFNKTKTTEQCECGRDVYIVHLFPRGILLRLLQWSSFRSRTNDADALGEKKKKKKISVQESMDDKSRVPMFIQHSMVCNFLRFCILSCCSFQKLTIKLNSAHLCPIPTDPFITSDRGERERENRNKRGRAWRKIWE
ncbi:hypothetical protein I7I48_11041 [Histoplasma ohiense]|nr:hypothetical protein I7I48_11041 [Histoplasma ohiense (nom. inval.)]